MTRHVLDATGTWVQQKGSDPMGMPFNPSFPTLDPGFTTPDAADRAVRDRIRLHETAWVWLDSFTGSSDDAKLAAAFSHAAAQTYPPAILLSNRAHTLNGTYRFYDGLRLVGSPFTTEREFPTTGPQCVATVGGAALFTVPGTGVKNAYVAGIQFRAASGTVNWQTPVADLAAGPIVKDAVFEKLGWVGFSSVMQARHLRCRIDDMYCNNCTDTPFKLAGSDNYYFTRGYSYLSSTALAATKYYIWFTHMSRSKVGGLYLTPEKATGFRIDGSYGNLQFDGTLLDCTNRDGTRACQGAAILITGGRGITFRGCWFFNTAANPSATGRSPQDRGQVHVRGNASDLLFDGCEFPGGDAQTVVTPAGTPAIYAATGVTNVKVTNPIAPAGGTKLLQQQSSRIITKYGADDWTLAVA